MLLLNTCPISLRHPQCPNLHSISLQISLWVVTEVLRDPKPAHSIAKMITVAEKLHKSNDFNGLLAVISGLCNSSIQRLTQAWKKVSSKHMQMKTSFEELMSPVDGK